MNTVTDERRLSKEQEDLLIAFARLGYGYLGESNNGMIHVFKNRPQKRNGRWVASGPFSWVTRERYEILKSLVSFKDTKPFNIKQALKESL